jgi:hypothetical protein
MKDLYQTWTETRNITTVYDVAIEKYSGEIKGLEWQISQEKYKPWRDSVKEYNVSILKKELRKTKTKLTKLLKLRKQSI